MGTIRKPTWYNRTTQKSDHCLGIVLFVFLLLFQATCAGLKHLSTEVMAAMLDTEIKTWVRLVRLIISMKTKDNLGRSPFWEKLVLALNNIANTTTMDSNPKTIENWLKSTENKIEKSSWYSTLELKSDKFLHRSLQKCQAFPLSPEKKTEISAERLRVSTI